MLKLCYRKFNDRFEQPSLQELNSAFDKADLNTKEIAELVGVDARTVQRWREGTRTITYAPWRLFLIETSLVEP